MSISPTDAQISELLLAKFPAAKDTLSKLSAVAVVRGITGISVLVEFDEKEIEACRSFVHIANSVRTDMDQWRPELTDVFDRVAEAFERFPEIGEREPEAMTRLSSALNYVGAVKLSSAAIVAPKSISEANGHRRSRRVTSFL